VLAVSVLFLLASGALASAVSDNGSRAGNSPSSQATVAPTPPLAPSPTAMPVFTPAPAAPTTAAATPIPVPPVSRGPGIDTLVVVALALLVIAIAAILYIRNK
jgi:hypothetical protein